MLIIVFKSSIPYGAVDCEEVIISGIARTGLVSVPCAIATTLTNTILGKDPDQLVAHLLIEWRGP